MGPGRCQSAGGRTGQSPAGSLAYPVRSRVGKRKISLFPVDAPGHDGDGPTVMPPAKITTPTMIAMATMEGPLFRPAVFHRQLESGSPPNAARACWDRMG